MLEIACNICYVLPFGKKLLISCLKAICVRFFCDLGIVLLIIYFYL